MHPSMVHELARIKMAEQLQYAERERRIRAAGKSRPQTIDSVPFRVRVGRALIRLGQGVRGTPVAAGA
jgi:hypothetical protein